MSDWTGSLTPIAPTALSGISAVVTYLEGLSWLSSPVAGQYLEGLADGTNRIFKIPFAPIAQSPAPILYTMSGGIKSVLIVSSLDYDAGEVIFASAPTTSPLGSYTSLAVQNSALQSVSLNGFTEMQVRWARSLYVYANQVSSSASSFVDPVVGSTTFSASPIQNALLNRCAEYELCRMLATGAIQTSISYREERMGGLLVDTSRRPGNWDAHLKMLAETLQRTEDAARSEAGDLADFGDFLPGPELIDGEWTDADF